MVAAEPGADTRGDERIQTVSRGAFAGGGGPRGVWDTGPVNTERPILLIEDDIALAGLIVDFLRQHGFDVATEGRGDRAVARILSEQPAAVVLDVMLPGLDGLSVCRQVRDRYPGPILILTARGEEIDEVLALELGADDFMPKPVRPRVLLARLQALLRRHAPRAPARRIVAGRVIIDAGARSVSVDGATVELSTAEFELLWVLAERAGGVVERDELYRLVRGIEWDGLDRSVDLRVSRLRKRLGDEEKPHRVIKSVRGTGYQLATDP